MGKLEELGVLLERLVSAEGDEAKMSMYLRDLSRGYLAALIEHRKVCRFATELLSQVEVLKRELDKPNTMQGDPRCDV